jgi:hypothetical protein
MALKLRALALAGALGTTTILAAPAAAATLPTSGLGSAALAFDHSRYDRAAESAEWRCRGWGCGYGRRGFRRYRRGPSAGDVLIGAAIIGGIAAIVSSNNRRERDRDVVIVERDVRDRDYNPRFEERRDDRRADARGTGSAGLDSAVDQCLARVERDVRVDTVDNVERTGSGWRVVGTLFNGTYFQCRIGNDGQIGEIEYGPSFSGAPSVPYLGKKEAQWSDDRYADARARLARAEPVAVPADQPLPAYPGGPIPGEVIPEDLPVTADSEV